MRLATMLAAVLITLTTVALGEEGKPLPSSGFIQEVVAGEAHVNGDASWDSVFFSHLSSTCWLTGETRKRELGEQAGIERRADYLDCDGKSAWIYNKGAKPLLCEGEIRMRIPDDSGRTVIKDTHLVPPQVMTRLVTAFTYEANRPTGYTTQCVVASEKEVLERQLPVGCQPKFLSVADPDAFYPAEAKAQNRTGVVTLDSAIDAKSQRLRDVFVSESYAGRDFEIAALRVAMNSRMAPEDCGGKRLRFRVKFNIKATEPEAPAAQPAAPAPAANN